MMSFEAVSNAPIFMVDFNFVFWGLKSDPLSGISVLYDHFIKGIDDLDYLSNVLLDYAAANDQMGQKLAEQTVSRSFSSLSLFGSSESVNNENSMFKNMVTLIKQEISTVGNTHKLIAQNILQSANEIKAFIDENKQKATDLRIPIIENERILAELKQQIEICRTFYNEKYQSLKEQESEKEQESLSIQIGSLSLEAALINELVMEMQYSVPYQDIKQLFGLYKDCYLGSDLIKVIQGKYNADDCFAFMNELLKRGVLKGISRGSTFVSMHFYQFKQTFVKGETMFQFAKREYKRATLDYEKQIKIYESTRIDLIEMASSYLNYMQESEKKRLVLMKQSLEALQREQSRLVPAISATNDQIAISLETLDPERELQSLIERERTGYSRFDSILFKSNENSYGNQIFGVPLQILSKSSLVPLFVQKSIEILDNYENKQDLIEFWCSPLPARTHRLKESVNGDLEKISANDLVQLLKLFFMEMPISVCHSELYEPLKLLYLSKSEDFDISMRLNSIRSLVSTLSSGHHETLKVLTRHLKIIVTDEQNITKLSVLGWLVLRPENETPNTIHDKHPSRLVKDLVLYYEQVFDSPALVEAKVQEPETEIVKEPLPVQVYESMSVQVVKEEVGDTEKGSSLDTWAQQLSAAPASAISDLQAEEIIKNQWAEEQGDESDIEVFSKQDML